MNEGFIKIYRSLLRWEWYTDGNTMRVFFHLLLSANWEDSRYRGHEVPKGSLVCGRKKLAEDLKMSEQEIRTSLLHLKSTNEITIQATNRFSIITIVNWEKFQGLGKEATNNQPTNQPTTQPTNQPTNNQRKLLKIEGLSDVDTNKSTNKLTNQATNNPTTYKEIKNIRNKEYYNNRFDANKGCIRGNYDFQELERETKEKS